MKKVFCFSGLFMAAYCLFAMSLGGIEESKLVGQYDNCGGDFDYSLSITCPDGKGVVVNGYAFVQEDETVTVTYDSGRISGGYRSGGSTDFTTLYINDKEITTSTSFIVSASSSNTIKMTITSLGNSDTTVITKFERTFIPVKKGIIGTDFLGNYSGVLGSYSGTLSDQSKYSLSVSSSNAFGRENIWWVRKGESIVINYKSAEWGGGYGTEFGWSASGENTELWINGVHVFDEKLIPSVVDKDLTIEFKVISGSSSSSGNNTSSTHIQKTILVKVDDSSPTKPTLSGTNTNWTNSNFTITASGCEDSGTGVRHYEYKVGDADWTRGDKYTSNVSEGSILNTNVKFRAVDFLGNVSDEVSTVVKVDKKTPVISAKNSSGQAVSENTWYNDNLTITATDEGSGMGKLKVNDVEKTSTFVADKSGTYKVAATDSVGNSSSKTFNVDKSSPVITGTINGGSYSWNTWTKEDVIVSAKDDHSGIAEFKVNDKAETNPKKLSGTGTYTVTAKDKVGVSAAQTVRIDQTKPNSTWETEIFNKFEYKTTNEETYLDSYKINYSVQENDSGIAGKGNILQVDGKEIYKCSEKSVSFTDNCVGKLDRENDNELTYSVNVKDNASNESTVIEQKITIPRKLQIRILDEKEETPSLKKTRVISEGARPEKYTTVGILINKIDFSLYKTIKLKRTFLGGKSEDSSERTVIDYETYKKFFDVSVTKSSIDEKWNALQECIITSKDVEAVTINNQEYWYYEDKIKTDSGMGHKGIRYQTEWVWDSLTVTEKGNYAEIEKTANNPGNLKIRIEGRNDKGEISYIVLDKDGNKIEDESNNNFMIPADGVVKLAFMVEDDDAEKYTIEGREYIKAKFINEKTMQEEIQTVSVAMEGSFSSGNIIKKKVSGKDVSIYQKEKIIKDGWYEFDKPEVKLYFNKPFNMKITMTEGCEGNSGAYKDVTSSELIMLKADNPDLGGFKLLVGEEAGYNTDGITAQPHQKIKLDLEVSEGNGALSNITWDYGDGTVVTDSKKDKNGHAYRQSSKRTGNTSDYKLMIKLEQNNTAKKAELNVYIVDTQVGVLLGDEEWIGKHPLRKKVQVGPGTTLRIVCNEKNKNDPTLVLGISSALDEDKGHIEILDGGKLIIEGSEETKIIFTEGKNGTEFSEVRTRKDGGNDESLKWKGITVKSKAGVSIKNAEIKYAQKGIEVTNSAVITVENTNIKNCSVYGMTVNGNVASQNISISGCENGIEIQEKSSINATGLLYVTDVKKGIICNGCITAEKINLNEIKGKGITLNGKLTASGSITVNGTGSEGLSISKNAELTANELFVLGFTKGITSEGIIKFVEMLEIDNSSDYGVMNTGTMEGNKLIVKDADGRGFVAGKGSDSTFIETEVSAGEIGIHCVGNAKSDFGKVIITGGVYGIKTDKDESGSPEMKINDDSTILDSKVMWYDWQDGVLTEEEMNSKKTKKEAL